MTKRNIANVRREYPHHVVVAPSRIYKGTVAALHDRFDGSSWCDKAGSRTFGFEDAETADAFRAYWASL